MATRRSARISARIQARQQQNCEETVPRTSNDVASTTKVYCLCRLPEDGRFMICCDHCDEWYHGDCVGITPDNELEMKGDNKEYICPSCTSVTTLVSSASVGPPTTSVISPCEPCVDFQWGDKDGATFCKLIGDAFEVVVHWRLNSFLVLSGKAGKDFDLELARLYDAYANNTTLHSIAFTACCVFLVLLCTSEASC